MQNKNGKLEWRRMKKSDADLKKYGQNDASDLIVRTIEGLIAIKEVVMSFDLSLTRHRFYCFKFLIFNK